MRFKKFKFVNFKGIGDMDLDLGEDMGVGVYALVGLNESGKTSVLEAINHCFVKSQALDALGIKSQQIEDPHELIPIHERGNFNGEISVKCELEMDDDDVAFIKDIYLKKANIELSSVSKSISFIQKYIFVNSKVDKEKSGPYWSKGFYIKDGENEAVLDNDVARKAFRDIRKRVPSILYFPNFLFDFPDRIFLGSDDEDKKNAFFKGVVQDILDSIGNGMTVDEHIVARILSDNRNDRMHLKSVIGRMEGKLTEVIFGAWSSIFLKQVSGKRVSLEYGVENERPYIEFFISENNDSYRVSERSLGFRWFFVFLLLIKFRTYRLESKDTLFLLDEPASNLHPAAQKELLNSFGSLGRVIYATHSHYMINPIWLENTYIVKNEGINYEDSLSGGSVNIDVKIYKYRNFVSMFPSQTSYFQPILEAIEFKPSHFDGVRKAVLLEGKNDYYGFTLVSKGIGSEAVSFVPATSASNMDALIALYIGWGVDFIVILDADKEGERQKQRYIDLFGGIVRRKIFTYADIDPGWKGWAFEKLFSMADRVAIQSVFGGADKFDKKIFNQALQEIVSTERPHELDNETRERFSRILFFIHDKLQVMTATGN